jgi:hypothetical protein
LRYIDVGLALAVIDDIESRLHITCRPDRELISAHARDHARSHRLAAQVLPQWCERA